MDITIYPHKLSGTVGAIPSKSQAHRVLICAAFPMDRQQLSVPKPTRTSRQLQTACAHWALIFNGKMILIMSSQSSSFRKTQYWIAQKVALHCVLCCLSSVLWA